IQARMSSRRFPGKVLAPFRGRPLIMSVVDAVARVVARDDIVVVTSIEASDDPLALFLATRQVKVFRGELDRVFSRFCAAIQDHPCDWVVRICGDSPLLDPEILALVLNRVDSPADVVTTLAPRTVPRGHAVEMVRAGLFQTLDAHLLTPHEQEHVTPVFYRESGRFRLENVLHPGGDLSGLSYVVDTVEDLHKLEREHAG
ncbi:MAG: NTP transferase domain-containing protein, partial [Magnetococcales bacterium]|nr:NTP transferase domain-containing protein [Magnetococcales bacterium]